MAAASNGRTAVTMNSAEMRTVDGPQAPAKYFYPLNKRLHVHLNGANLATSRGAVSFACARNPTRRQTDPATLAADIVERLIYRIGKDAKVAKPHDWLTAAILVIRDRVIDRWMESTRRTYESGGKRVYYLSLEFLIGRLTRDAVSNLGLMDELRQALKSLGVDFDVIAALEPDAALGNGGLGLLAACFMESMATTDIPAYGY
eukprot:gene62456-85414_t